MQKNSETIFFTTALGLVRILYNHYSVLYYYMMVLVKDKYLYTRGAKKTERKIQKRPYTNINFNFQRCLDR